MPRYNDQHRLDSANIRAFRVFCAVVDTGGFSAAARHLHLGVSTISKTIANLEEKVDSALIYRNTREVTVTEAGEAFYLRCRRILDAVEDTTASGSIQDADRGHIRIVSSPAFATGILGPNLPRFYELHPRLTIELHSSSSLPNLAREGVDVAFILRPMREWKTASIQLATSSRVLCASPEYIKTHGAPDSPEDLAHHTCLLSLLSGVYERWPIFREGPTELSNTAGYWSSDDGNILKSLCVHGLGIASLYRFHVYDELARGTLVELFGDHRADTMNIYAVFPHKRIRSSRAKLLVDFVKAVIGDPPYWSP